MIDGLLSNVRCPRSLQDQESPASDGPGCIQVRRKEDASILLSAGREDRHRGLLQSPEVYCSAMVKKTTPPETMCGSRMVHHLIWRLRTKSSARTIWPISGRRTSGHRHPRI
ncbi:Uncharacterized protein FKW44_009192 [Caligus rogercresseyi]|uniref:Uncharacterized protein n=2 Tax=Caligus rogercresseyi TaxID=217165 RepID=A0A7T8HF85_CALRO|nr:Uncharacterized protein FKW44_009192 [Caligus rogercresseyi]